MVIKRDMSTKTFQKLENLIATIRQRAVQSGDGATYKDADEAIVLLRNLGSEIAMEDTYHT